MNTIDIEFNGDSKTIALDCDLKTAIALWQLPNQQFAIAVNENFIPQSQYHDTILQAGDRVELLVPMQGG